MRLDLSAWERGLTGTSGEFSNVAMQRLTIKSIMREVLSLEIGRTLAHDVYECLQKLTGQKTATLPNAMLTNLVVIFDRTWCLSFFSSNLSRKFKF